jgi:integrase
MSTNATERTPWTGAEVRTFIAELHEERLHAPMLLSLLGLRPAEACGLAWPDVELGAGTLSVQHAHSRRDR